MNYRELDLQDLWITPEAGEQRKRRIELIIRSYAGQFLANYAKAAQDLFERELPRMTVNYRELREARKFT